MFCAEHRTVAIYHATKTNLGAVDWIQIHFVRFSNTEVLMEFKFDSLRREIGMFGVIHCVVIGY